MYPPLPTHTHTHWPPVYYITYSHTSPAHTLHARLHTPHMYFLKNKPPNTRSERVVRWQCPPLMSPYQNKNTGRGDSTYPPSPSLSAGVIDGDVRSQCTFPVACQPDACWQPPPTPPCLTAPAWRRGYRRDNGIVRVDGEKQLGGGMIPTPCPCSCLTPPPSTSMLASLSLQANAEWWNESEEFLQFPSSATFTATKVINYKIHF